MRDIVPGSLKVEILPLPKRFARGAAQGFCGGFPVGRVETSRARSAGCWWPRGKPELLTLEGRAEVLTGRASGSAIPGHWANGKTGAMGAAVWGLHDGALRGTELHVKAYAKTWAIGAGGGAVVGVGTPPRKHGTAVRDVGLVFREDAPPVVIAADGEVMLNATDGVRLAGSVDGRAALWTSADAPPTDLAPEGFPASEVQALDGDIQVGVAFKGLGSRAGLWRGTAATFIDLTPRGFATGRAAAGAAGFQVGFVRRKDTTRNGSSGCDNQAALWRGEADSWIDLNASLAGTEFNASVAWAIEVTGDSIRVCGEASRFEVNDAETPRENHYVPAAHPVLWTARVSG
ncbi:MAG: hypothetical protein K1Y01_08140 [Vicinamibacteria bacterium]|nr:hypothetical protein [Vicinamibacteria bacterium]